MISKREKILISLLVLFAFLGGYYKFILIPININYHQSVVAKEEKQIEFMEITQRLLSQEDLNNDIKKITNDILNHTNNYFGVLHQEDIILLIDNFTMTNNLRISTLKFTQPSIESFINSEEELKGIIEEEALMKIFSIKCNFEGSYEDLIDFLKNINQYEKKIIIKNINIKTKKVDMLAGNVLLNFYSLPIIAKYYPREINTLSEVKDLEKDELKTLHPFIPYNELLFIKKNVPFSNLNSNNDNKNFITLYSFEDANVFFVGNSENVYGEVKKDLNAIEGNYAISIKYDFIRSDNENIACLDLEGNSIIIPRQPEIFSLWTYAFEKSDHVIGVVLIDARGKEFKFELIDKVDWLGWRPLRSILPVNIVYPAMIQRIYIEGTSYSNKTKGQLLFDKMEVAYPEVFSYSNEMN